jgi:hypothetical protein
MFHACLQTLDETECKVFARELNTPLNAILVHSYGAAVTAEAAAAARLINTSSVLGETSLINKVIGVISILY